MDSINHILCQKRAWTVNKMKHTHDFGHLIFPLKGALSMETKDQSAIIDNKKLFFLPPNSTHIFSSDESWTECLVVDIPVLIASSIPKLTNGVAKIVNIDKNWEALRSLILSESYKKYPSLNHLLYYSFGLLQDEEETPSLRYIHEHCFEDISIEILAKLEHYNVSYYGQWFQQKMHRTPQQYIQQLRLNEAKRLLRETNYSNSYITQYIGYSHQSYLTRIFKQSEGITPAQYRSYNKDKKA